ncbi:hypothetical protein JCM10296v2_006033 [Rhodotorula toruloides]
MFMLYTGAPLMRGPALSSKLLLTPANKPGAFSQTRAHTARPSSPPPPPPSSPPPPLHSSSSSRQSSGRHYSWSEIAQEAFEWLFLLWALGLWYSLLDLWRGYIQATIDACTFIASVFYRGWDWLLGSKTTLRVLERTHARLQQRYEETDKDLKVLRGTLEEITRTAPKVDAFETEHEEMGEELQAVAALSKDATTLVSRVTEAKDRIDKEPQPATHDAIATLAALVESVKKLTEVGLEVSKIRWASLDYNKALAELRREVGDVKAQQELTAEQYAHLAALEHKLVHLLEKGHNNEVPVGVVIGVGLLGIGIWLHLWSKQSITFPSVEGLTLRVRTVTTVAEHKVRELQTELYDVRSKLWDDIRNARSESASDVRSIRSELAKVDRKVHQHYLEFIPVQAKLRAVELRAIDPVADRSRVNAVLGDVRDELGAVRQSQAQTQAEVGAVRNQQAALEGMFDKLEKQKIERRRKKEEMANRRLV